MRALFWGCFLPSIYAEPFSVLIPPGNLATTTDVRTERSHPETLVVRIDAHATNPGIAFVEHPVSIMMGLAAMSCRRGIWQQPGLDSKITKTQVRIPAGGNRTFHSKCRSPVAGIRHFLFISLKRRLAPSARYVTHLPPYE